MTRKLSVLFCIAALGLAWSASFAAATWTVFSVPEVYWSRIPDWSPRDITFTLDSDILSLNTQAIGTDSGSSSVAWKLMFSGDWAVFGSVDPSGALTRDPYASFNYDGLGGSISWATNTPDGYTAPLLFGYDFTGNGATTYSEYAGGEPSGVETTGTLVLKEYLPMRSHEQDIYTAQSHDLNSGNIVYVSNVPEPPALVAMLCGIVGLAGTLLRRGEKL